MLDMAKRLVQQNRDVRVIQPVDRLSHAAFPNNEIQIAQDPQLVRDRGLRHLYGLGQLTNAARTLAKTTQDLHPTRCPQAGHHACDLMRCRRADASL
jgi:hypothetical protein